MSDQVKQLKGVKCGVLHLACVPANHCTQGPSSYSKHLTLVGDGIPERDVADDAAPPVLLVSPGAPHPECAYAISVNGDRLGDSFGGNYLDIGTYMHPPIPIFDRVEGREYPSPTAWRESAEHDWGPAIDRATAKVAAVVAGS